MERIAIKHLMGLAVLVLTACGGKIDAGLDGGTDAAADTTNTDAWTGVCSEITFSNPPPNPGGSCDAIGSWSCGTTKYSVECTCGVQGSDPQCTCTKVMPGPLSEVTGGSQASGNCYGLTVQSVVDVCGFPH